MRLSCDARLSARVFLALAAPPGLLAAQEDVLRAWDLPADYGNVWRLDVLPDVSGDGVPEILIADLVTYVDGQENAGLVQLLSGEALDPPLVLRRHAGAREFEYLGS